MALHSAAVGLEVAAAAVPFVGWALLVPMAAYDTYSAYHHYKHVTHHAKDFASRLVLKSDCMEESITITRTAAEKPEGFLKKEVGEVCGKEVEAKLSKQMQRTNYEMIRLLQTLESVGRCLWPHGE